LDRLFEHPEQSGWSKQSSGEAAAEGDTAGVALGYGEDVAEERTKPEAVFTSR